MYHKVHPTSPTEWWVEVDEFHRQMWELQSRRVVYLDDYDPADPENVVITFDGVYANVLTYAAPILESHGYPFELFVTGDYVGRDNDFDVGEPSARFATLAELEALEGIGGRLQWHTRTHPDLSMPVTAERLARELTVPGELLGNRPESFGWLAYPYGRYGPDSLASARTRFRGAVSCVQGDDQDRHRLNRVTVRNDTSFARGGVACIISSYNYGPFLTEAVESVLRQTVRPREILITDDASEDETREVAEEFARQYEGLIRFNRNERNLGIVANFNRAVEMTDSEYVMILGADNRLASNYVEACASLLEKDPELGIVYTEFDLFGSRARLMYESYPAARRGRVTADTFYRVLVPEARVDDPAALKGGNFIHGSSMYRRSAFDSAGGYRERGTRPEDHDLFQRILGAGYTARLCPETTLYYRQHSRDQANVRLMSYATLLHYVEKSRRLERELRLAESSLWRRLFYPARLVRRNVRRLTELAGREGLRTALLRAFRSIGRRRAASSPREVAATARSPERR